MQLMENTNGIAAQLSRKESTRILRYSGRCGTQQILDHGFGKTQNTDFEPLHYQNS